MRFTEFCGVWQILHYSLGGNNRDFGVSRRKTRQRAQSFSEIGVGQRFSVQQHVVLVIQQNDLVADVSFQTRICGFCGKPVGRNKQFNARNCTENVHFCPLGKRKRRDGLAVA